MDHATTRYSGKINWVQIDIGPRPRTWTHKIGTEQRFMVGWRGSDVPSSKLNDARQLKVHLHRYNQVRSEKDASRTRPLLLV